ncbi:DUF2235 domain-containing protein [Candidatus Binatia bacterium]|nr:DUF2235 domain-containing protein [Candidatus Binatia bacterium]
MDHAQNGMKRLVVCLDGTWNKRDSGTNVYHLANLVDETKAGANHAPVQRVYYDEGVGTGMLDSVTGGGFGIGLADNVRQACDWLIENYDEGDHVFVFGFSRGAFTARSLVGLIAKCGLLRRGAPLSVEELWRAYQILGRLPHERTRAAPEKNWWERIVGREMPPFGPIWELQRDWWDPSDEQRRVEEPVNRSEELLREWSRRIPIECVGVFDTVGSLGLDALAIPWLRDRMAQFHDTHFTSVIQNGFQALAIDEHRANFSHIPWRLAQDPERRGAARRIEQRWFIGAHSNVGGGYEDDDLAQFSLAWMMTETGKLGLRFRKNPVRPPDLHRCVPLLATQPATDTTSKRLPRLRDSYAEFGRGLWQYLIRAKREYRQIDPPAELENGILVKSANETLDPSVLALAEANRKDGHLAYDPPNLWEVRHRDDRARRRAGANVTLSPPPHEYLPSTCARIMLVLWLVAAGASAGALASFFLGPPGWLLAPVAALVALGADYVESRFNHEVALAPEDAAAERKLAILELCLTIRLFGIAILVWGLILLAVRVSPWLVRLPADPGIGWLLLLDGLFLFLDAARAWCAAPMSEAGLGSIVVLQRCRTPEAVRDCFAKWSSIAGNHAFRQPVERSLWRDVVGFIPEYSLVLFIGTWVALSLHVEWSGAADWWLFSGPSCGWPLAAALLLVVMCATADLVEDALHLRFLRLFVDGTPDAPGHAEVRLAATATLLKSGLFGLGWTLSVLAAAWLSAGQLRLLGDGAGGPSVLLVAVTAFLIYGQVQDLLTAVREQPPEPS